MTAKLAEGGVLGLLCSNRFLTTKGGHSLRSVLLRHYEVAELWDLGDTKLFGAAVLPAVVVARRVAVPSPAAGSFVRIYEDHGHRVKRCRRKAPCSRRSNGMSMEPLKFPTAASPSSEDSSWNRAPSSRGG
jgi:hypothetical protein